MNKVLGIMNKKRREKEHKGFTLLFSVLLTSLLLGIGLSILNITVKQIVLTSVGKQSLIAFYAADSGVECARYWDLKRNAFPTTTSPSTIYCGSNPNITPVSGGPTPNLNRTFTFRLSVFGPSSNATVNVVKEANNPSVTVTSRGYNTTATSDRKTERGLELKY